MEPTPSNIDFRRLQSNILKADYEFNKSIFQLASYTLTGLGVGLVACLMFKNKSRVIFFSAGAGAGWGSFEFGRTLAEFRKKRGY
jgi:hypothetical protein